MKKVCAVAVLLLVPLSAGLAQRAEIALWPVPTADSLPADLAFSSDGMVFFSEFRGGKIGKLDPTGNTIAERDVGASPAGIWVDGTEMIYFTAPLEDALRAVVFTSGGAGWNLPTSGGWPEHLVAAPSGPGTVNLWINERLAGKVARFSPSQVAVTLPLFQFPLQPVTPDVLEVDPLVVPVTPEFHPGNPALPPPIALLAKNVSGPFTEWTAMNPAAYVEDLALAPDGMVWFTQDNSPLARLDPGSDTVLLYSLPSGTQPLGIEVASGGTVWFTDTSRPAIGSLDPTTGGVTFWPIPGGVQPIEAAVDPAGGVWFADREGDAIGLLAPSRNEISLWRLPQGSYPVTVKLAGDGSVWFACERGNTIGRLQIIPTTGQPPQVPPPPQAVVGECNILSYSIFQSGNHARVNLVFNYEGSQGLPVQVGVVPTRQGVDAPGFAPAEEEVATAGPHSVTLIITYAGSGVAETDGLRFYVRSVSGVFCENFVDFQAVWTP